MHGNKKADIINYDISFNFILLINFFFNNTASVCF